MNKKKKRKVEKKVRAWQKRINNLYSFVETVLANRKDLTFKKTDHVKLYERKMHKYGVKPVNIPVLDIFKNKFLIATFKPRGLWVVGAEME